MKTEINQVVHATDENFDALKNESPLILAEFSADWCGPCKMMEPVLDELARDFAGQATIVKVDIEANSVLSEQYRIRNLPTLLFFKDGQLANRSIGFTTKKVLAQEINNLLAENSMAL